MDYKTTDTDTKDMDIETAEEEDLSDSGEEMPEEGEEGETPQERKAREEREAKEREFRAKKRKLIPPFVMLLAGAITSITMRVLHYDMRKMLIILLCVLIGFYMAGCVIKYMLDRFERQIEEASMEEGEVIEKEPAEEDRTNRVSRADVKDE